MSDIHDYLETVRLLPDADTKEEQPPDDRYGQTSEQRRSVLVVLVALGFMYSVHNLIAPNMTALARLFHFNNFERDAYIGGELTLFFYSSGVLGALLGGVFSGVADRVLLLTGLAVATGISCLLTARVATFNELVWARALTGLAIGGLLPVVYSLVGDWFPAKRRATATAYVTAASGIGVFMGQCLATLMGSVDWRWPFLVIAVPSLGTGLMICWFAREPERGGQEEGVQTLFLHRDSGISYVPTFSGRRLRVLLRNRTNMLVILQAFPGNIPWGVIIVYMHDFMVQDLGLSRPNALGAIAMLCFSAFMGVLVGGAIGESLYGTGNRRLALFGGICNICRAVPFLVIFGWRGLCGPLEKSSESAFLLVLVVGGFVATMSSPCTGAMLLNVNLPETRGTVAALYAVLDDFSKGFGTLIVSMLVRLVGGRPLAYQLTLLLWVLTGIALLFTWYTYDEDEAQMRRDLNEAAMESMVLHSKRRAQEAIRDRAKAAGQTHFVESKRGGSWRDKVLKVPPPQRGLTAAQTRGGLLGPGGDEESRGAASSSSSTTRYGSNSDARGSTSGVSPGADHGSPWAHVAAARWQKERLKLAVKEAAKAAAASSRSG